MQKKMARKLFIERVSVYQHLVQIRKKLGAHNNFEILHVWNDRIKFNPGDIKLTPRGGEVFRLTLEGLEDKQIAERLGISYSGVRRHKEKMLWQNECESMLALAAKYYSEYEPPK